MIIMERVREFIRMERNGWKKWEVIWLLFTNMAILAISLWLKDSTIGILASLTGVTCVIFCGKGKVSNYIFGTVNVLLYSYVAFHAKYYGDVMLNLLYYFPTNIIGWYAWKRHINQESNEVFKRRLSLKQDVLVIIISITGVFGYSYILRLLGGNLPIVDSMSTVLSIVAQILMIKRFMEQWAVWILVDVVSVIMWVVAFAKGGENIAVLMMWLVYLANAVIMFIKWYRDSKKEIIQEEMS